MRREGEVHVIATRLHHLSGELAGLGEREAGFPLPHGRGDNFHHGSAGSDSPDRSMRVIKPRDIHIPDLHIDTLKVEARDLR